MTRGQPRGGQRRAGLQADGPPAAGRRSNGRLRAGRRADGPQAGGPPVAGPQAGGQRHGGLPTCGCRRAGVDAVRPRNPTRLERRVGEVIVVQLLLAASFAVLAAKSGAPVGSPAAILALTGAFVITNAFDMSLELQRHKFTFTPGDAVLVVGFFVVGPIGLATAFAVAETANMVAQHRGPLKVLFNVVNRLAAVTIAGVAFQALGRTSTHDMAAWGAALAAALCFSLIDVVATAVVISRAEDASFQHVFVRSAST